MQAKVVSFVLFFTLCNLTYSNTIHVPGDYPSIQAALINAATSDTILVGPGTYYEHLSWPNTQGIKLLSEYGPDTTIIDAAGALRCITINLSVDSNTVISGFTICNGNMANGGGISCIGASPCIINNIITNNSTGSGIWIDSGDPMISDNIISHNTGYDGGGISCRMFGNPRIAHNLIEYNAATSAYGSGGGICAVDAQLIIEDNIIRHNTAQTGGGIYTFKTYSIFRYNTITDNTAEYGAGIRFYQSDATVNHNDIFDNGYGMSSGFMTGQINAESNWWGDVTGPYHTTNPGGLGDTVSDYVDFIPWMTKPHGIEEQSLEVPVSVHLTAIPNPFNHLTDIRYETTDDGPTQRDKTLGVRIYDASGKLVRDFGQLSVIGHQLSVKWDGTDHHSRQLRSGVYFLKLNVANETTTQKIVLID